jgi:acyl carrier protein
MDKLIDAFRNTIGIQDAQEIRSASYRATKGWDSVAHMRLVGELETLFDIMLDTDDVIGMSSFEKATEILRKYGVDVAA